MMVELTDRATISRAWQIELGWDQARCDQEFDGECWRNFLEWGEQVWFREGEGQPCINMFTAPYVPAGHVDICCSIDDLRRHTPYADEPS